MVVIGRVVIAGDVVDLFAAVRGHGTVLAKQFFTVAVAGRDLVRGEIAGVDHDVPLERGRSFDESFRLSQRFGQALAPASNVRRNMSATGHPAAELPRFGLLRVNRADGGTRGSPGSPNPNLRPQSSKRRSALRTG